jgi:CYTH domain-containing protein
MAGGLPNDQLGIKTFFFGDTMGTEIERKFMVKKGVWRDKKATKYRQGYLSIVKERTVRVRTIEDKGYLTIKGISIGASRLEFEYEIPRQDADALLDICEKPLIEKNRYKVENGGFVWEVDEFFGENQGLIVAELELESEDQYFPKPDWIGEEVTGDPRYFNSNLIKNPYSKW